MSGNGYEPRHNPDRAKRLANDAWHRRLRRRARLYVASWPRSWWVRLASALAAAVVALAVVLAVTLVHHAGKVHGGDQHSHAAATVREVTSQHCLEALSRAETAMDAAKSFGEGMASFHTEALALAKFLAPGDAGRPVRQLQEKLRDAGADIEVDADYGPETKAAVEEFRDKHGKHAADSKDYLAQLANTREAYASAAEQCRGGE